MIDRQLPNGIRFGREVCGDLEQAERREWWLANRNGAYASGTLAGSLTRRYHGLLVAPLIPPLGRCLVLAKADATLSDGEREWPLFTNRWADGNVTPAGHVHIECFRLEGRLPVWCFAIGDIRIEQRIWLAHDRDTTHVAWRLVPGGPDHPLELRVALLVNARDHHGVTWPGAFAPTVSAEGERLQVSHPDWFELHITAEHGTCETDSAWVERFDLPLERERGLEDQDSHLRAGQLSIQLHTDGWSGFTASLDNDPAPTLGDALDEARRYENGHLDRARTAALAFAAVPPWIEQLVLAADAFVFKRPLPGVADGESVIAGYPWFGDWGRDTMIALPGLTLATGRLDSARRILETFARFVDGGMLPNVFPSSGETPEYNTVDAALWYFEAWRAYLQAGGDQTALLRSFPILEGMIDAHLQGTRYGIRVDPEDGLLRAGEPGVQLTWMDAKVGDWVVTPRIGKPVEINALWYNVLRTMAEFARIAGADPTPYEALARRVSDSFGRYLRPDGLGLFDVIDGPEGDDASIRPNQIFAVSLWYSPLTPEQQCRVVAECGRELLTSVGLRSLARSHPDYRPHYQGDVWSRDGSYHQGPVWGWLLGHYALAEYRVSGNAALALSRLEPIADHLHDAALGTVSEIFDGSPPHKPRGAPAQAWSVACTLEAWWRLQRAKDGQTLFDNQ